MLIHWGGSAPSLSSPVMKTAEYFKWQTPESRGQLCKGQTVMTSLRQNTQDLLTNVTRYVFFFTTKKGKPSNYAYFNLEESIIKFNLILIFNSYNWNLTWLFLPS